MSAIAAAQADERKCERCGGLFLPARADAKFCSGRCRVAAHRAAGSLSVTRLKPPEPLEPLAVTAQSQGPAPLSVTESEPLSVAGSGRSVTKTAPEPPASVTSPAADVRQSADDETLVYETIVSAPIAEPEGSGAPKGERNGNYRHGRFTCEAIAMRREVAALGRSARNLIEAVFR